MLSLVELADVHGRPKLKMDLPPLLVGSRVRLRFVLRRENGGRTEQLNVDGQFRVEAIGLDCARGERQLIALQSAANPPSWRAVKKTPEWRRVLPPAIAPRTAIT